jgi:hypothetical protein
MRSWSAWIAVLAKGMDGGGAWRVPKKIVSSLPRHRYHHSREIFDEAKLKGKNVGIQLLPTQMMAGA